MLESGHSWLCCRLKWPRLWRSERSNQRRFCILDGFLRMTWCSMFNAAFFVEGWASIAKMSVYNIFLFIRFAVGCWVLGVGCWVWAGGFVGCLFVCLFVCLLVAVCCLVVVWLLFGCLVVVWLLLLLLLLFWMFCDRRPMSSPVKGCAMLEEAAKPPHRRIVAGKAAWDRWSVLA